MRDTSLEDTAPEDTAPGGRTGREGKGTNGGVGHTGASPARVEYAVDIVGLSKRFVRRTRGRSGYGTLKSAGVSLAGRLFGRGPRAGDAAPPPAVTAAVDALTLRIPRGASVGIIGRNGSGKSTLLKLITGIYAPDEGTVSVNGRLAALIELGAGFHPDFTGRENLKLGGILHGLSRREIAAKFDEIVRFAELESFIDDPVRTYSSGMFMRLGFSLAVHTDPHVLLVDEVLAVGDAAFVAKCKEKIAELRREGRTLLLVTHDLDAVERWCDEAVWLDKGVVKDRGDPRRVIDNYRRFVERGEEEELGRRDAENSGDAVASSPARDGAASPETAPGPGAGPRDGAARWGSREVEITAARLLGPSGAEGHVFRPDDQVSIEIDFVTHCTADDLVFGVAVTRDDGLSVHGTNTDICGVAVPAGLRSGTVTYVFDRVALLDAVYTLDVAVHRRDGYPFDYRRRIATFAVRSPEKHAGVFVPKYRWSVAGAGEGAPGGAP